VVDLVSRLAPERRHRPDGDGRFQVRKVVSNDRVGPWGLCAALLLTLVTAGCAARGRTVVVSQPEAAADELVRAGCYDCLLDARKAYEGLAAQSTSARLRLFEVNLLLALREKELALDASPTLDRAASLVPRLPDSLPAEQMITAVRSIPPDAAGRRVLPPSQRDRETMDTTLRTIGASPASGLFTSYLTLSLQCGRLQPDPAPSDAQPVDEPLLNYRRAICDNPIRTDPLRTVRQTVPRFAETSFFLGRAAMASLFRTDGREARELFEEAYARFPASPTIAFSLGTVYQAINDCRRAEDFFTRTLTLAADHDDARLGRIVCRTYMSDSRGAIDDATVLIDRNGSNLGDAFYWRAWNRRHSGELEPARADIDRARALRYNARVLLLAGMIEYDQRQFEAARKDLESVRALDGRECEAPWYLGLVGFSTEEWEASARGFAAAADCYAALIRDTEEQRAAMVMRNDVSEEFRARQLAGFDAAIAEDGVQRSASELNAAINYGRAGDLPNATIYMKRAAADPQRRLAVEDLRQVLGVPRW